MHKNWAIFKGSLQNIGGLGKIFGALKPIGARIA
jgi:hypothetical protein